MKRLSRTGRAIVSVGCALALTGCGAASTASKPGAATGKCVTGAAAKGAIGTAPLEPASGVNVLTGACWAKIHSTAIAHVVHLSNAATASVPAGVSATWKAAYTATNLYIYANVVTGRPVINTNTTNQWEDDSVEIYLSGSNSHTGAYTTDTGQLLINSGGLTNSTLGGDHSKLPTSGAKATEHTTSTGYQVLLAMPWANLGTTVKKGAEIGFTIGVDFPGKGATSRAKGGGQLMWQGGNTNWNNDTAWGALKLA